MILRLALALSLYVPPAFAESRYNQMQILDKDLICLMIEYGAEKVIDDRQSGMGIEEAYQQPSGLLSPLFKDIVDAAYQTDLESTAPTDFSKEWKDECYAGMQEAQQPIYDSINDELSSLRSSR